MKEIFFIKIVLLVLESTGIISSEMSCLVSIAIDSVEEHDLLDILIK
ncbi:hypothetical protein HX071_08545 [Myroides marinus]|nr:hypothetical protein [Myroides marinus]MDM1502252.1 hypothetical protein [Myroides marinus]